MENKDFKKLYLQEKRLNELILKFNQAENINEIFLELEESLIELFSCERVTIYAIDKKTKQLYSRLKTGKESLEIRVNIDNTSIAGYVANNRKLVNLKDAYDENERNHKYPGICFDSSWDRKSGFRTRSVLACPLILKNKYLVGVLQLINKKEGAFFDLEDETLIKKFAPGLAAALYHLLIFQSKFGKFDYLLENHKITYRELDLAIVKARKRENPWEQDVGWVLINEFNVSKEDIGKALSSYYNTEFISYSENIVLPTNLLKRLNIDYLKSRFWVPLKQEEDLIWVLIDDPSDEEKIREVYFSGLGDNIKFVVGLREDIIKFLNKYEEQEVYDGESLGEVLSELREDEHISEGEVEEDILSEDAPAIIKLVTKIIKDAYDQGVSDIHIEPSPGKDPTRVRFRRDGVCFKYLEIPSSHIRAFINRIKIMSNLDIAEKRIPQSGKIKLKYKNKVVELRVEVTPTVGGVEDVVMRILAAGKPRPLEKMNFTPRNLEFILGIINKPYGIFLVVGPTGSGKTTTLHSILGRLNTPEKKIWTAEDPVEITQPGLRQVQVNPKIGYTFASAMRSFLRADPDIIMVGEMRDQETAHTALEASLTGHLVLSTLHTNSAPETIVRLIDMGMNPFNFADALLGILAQRLVRTLCPKCKEPYKPDREEFDLLVKEYGEELFPELGITYSDDLKLYRAVGCAECGKTGYLGRTALHELLVATPKIKRLIVEGAPVEKIYKQGILEGMRTLKQDGIAKVFMGQVDFASVLKVCIV